MTIAKIQDEKTFDEAKSILQWSQYLMTAVGLCPGSCNDFIFCPLFFYICYQLFFEFVAFFLALASFNLMKIIGATMEMLTLLQIFLRLTTMRWYNKYYGEIVSDFSQNFSMKHYKSNEEKNMFLFYNLRAKLFVKILIVFTVLTGALYFARPLIRQLSTLKNLNSTATFYDLPYKMYIPYKITNPNMYIVTYISQTPIFYVVLFAQPAMDCLTLFIVSHLCGQLGVLSIRISNINIPYDDRDSTDVVEKHQKLIKIGLLIRNIYKLCLLVHFLTASIAVCILVYQILLSISSSNKTNLATFLFYGFLNIFRLYTHCWVGEYLIYESIRVSSAFYNSKWYTLPLKLQRNFIFCIKRSQKPLSLMAGNFSHFSLVMFANVIKSAMAYLSFLRNFI